MVSRKVTAVLLALLPPSLAQRQWVPDGKTFPATGNDTIAGGIFSISLPDLARHLASKGGMQSDVEAATPGGPTSGSGKYPARMFTDPSLPKHTLYAPKTPPEEPMPLLTWGNGACGTNGAGYRNFLTEIASHGYFVIADGAPAGGADSAGAGSGSGGKGKSSGLGLGLGGSGGGQSKYSDVQESLRWAKAGKGSKHGTIDLERIAAAGHSCGGLEAMSNAYHDQHGIKLVMLFNIAIFQDNKRYLLKELKVPIAWFVGGPKDMGYAGAEKDYGLLPSSLPAYHASLRTGHMGTFSATNGGKSAKAAVNYLEWHFRGSEKARRFMTGNGTDTMRADKWEVKMKNWRAA